MNRSIQLSTDRKEDRSRPKSAWELRELSRPLRERGRVQSRWQPKMMNHYPAVVEFLYQHRYATAAHVQQSFPRHIRTDRSARYQLLQLERLGLVARASIHST